jgi:hypothetical protein
MGHEVGHSSHSALRLRMGEAVTPFPHTPLWLTDRFTFYNFISCISQPHLPQYDVRNTFNLYDLLGCLQVIVFIYTGKYVLTYYVWSI